MAESNEAVTGEMEGFNQLPPVLRIEEKTLPSNSILLAAMGFEERSLATISMLRETSTRVRTTFLVKYDPPSGPNKEDETKALAESISDSKPIVFRFDRFQSSSYLELETQWARIEDSRSKDAIIDISGMSRFLILSILFAARNSKKRILLVHFEPKKYHPTKNEFEELIRTRPIRPGPFIIKGGISNLLSSPWFSSVHFNERPVSFVGFPGFDSEFLTEPIEELAPESILLVEPGTDSEPWWRDAYKKLNRGVYESPGFRLNVVSARTQDYHDVLSILENLYRSDGTTHRIVVAPTGSKLQAIGSFFFKVIRPEVELVYPSPIEHNPHSVEGTGMGLVVDFGIFENLTTLLRGIRRKEVTKLASRLNEILSSSSGWDRKG